MGCKACIGATEEGQYNYLQEKENQKIELEFKNKFDNFLETSECQKTNDEDFLSYIEQNYLNYSKENELEYPPEIIQKEDLSHNMEPIKFKNGNIFKGNWNNEIQMEGKGEYYIKDDNVYIVGIWEKGELKYGRVFMPNGNIYEGYIKDSKYNGKGKLILPPDAEYEGFFENNEFKNGKMKWNNGYEYEGDFNGNCLEGKGKLTGPDGDIYEGYFDKSLFHGQGKYIYHNSQNEYDGEFQYGIKKGKGKYIAMNEYTYDGNWDNDIPFGYGKLTTWDNTCIFKCTFRAGKISEEPIYEIGSKDNFNQDNFEIKPEEMKLDTRNLTHLEVPKIEATEYKLGGNVSFLDE